MQQELPSDVAEAYPKLADGHKKLVSLFNCSLSLCGQTCVYFAAGKKALRGRYFDCEQDVGYVSSMGDEIWENSLYDLKVEFFGWLANRWGLNPRVS